MQPESGAVTVNYFVTIVGCTFPSRPTKMHKLARNMCLTQCSPTLKILHLFDVVVAGVWGLVLLM